MVSSPRFEHPQVERLTYLNVLRTQVDVGSQQQFGVFGSQSKRFWQGHDGFFSVSTVFRTIDGEKGTEREDENFSRCAQDWR